MSTYIEILRAHQRDKLKDHEPSPPDPLAAPPETPPEDESPDQLLQEELPETAAAPGTAGGDASAMAPVREPDTALLDRKNAEDTSPEGMLQDEEPASAIPALPPASMPGALGDIPPDLETAESESPDIMLQEEAATASQMPDNIEADRTDQDLPEEHSGPSLDLDETNETALGGLLPEESGEAAQDLDDMDDSLFAQMLPDEPEAPLEDAEQQGPQGDAALLADEAPEVAPQDTGGVAAENTVHTWLSGCVVLMVRLYEDAARDTPTDVSPLLHHLDRFSAKIYENPEELGALELDIANRIESIRASHADCGDLVQKAVMMMLYGFKICVQMRMEPAEITRYVAAAILHNIGMAQIFVDTRLKEGKLTNAERTLIRRVPEKSLDYLKRCGITDRVILLAAQQSHERHDGSGPHGLAGADIALSARIVGLLSMFEALVHVRSYRERLLPRDAIRELVNNYKNQFEPTTLKNLIESVSLYPVGTYVQLNSGDIGQVIRVQPRLPLRPKVVLIMDRQGNRIQPREVDLHKQPNLMVQRCMYREGLVPMKAEEEKAGEK